jgi:protein-disulfide isomerase
MTMTTTTRILSLCALLLACDAAKQADVDGLQQRLDTLASEQAELRKGVDEAKAAAATETTSRAALAADVAAIRAELDTAKAAIARLEAVPAPVLPKPAAGKPDPSARYRVDIADAYADGASDARVTVVIFSDFQCPFCVRVQATLDELQNAYKGDVRIVAKHNPLAFHANAMIAARAAEAAGKQGKFWEMHDELYANSKALAQSDLEGYAKKLKLDVAAFRRDMDAKDVQDRIDAHIAQARLLGATGTPSFFVNGRSVVGAQPLASFKAIVDEEIAAADAVIAGGVARSAVYDQLMATAKPGVGTP